MDRVCQKCGKLRKYQAKGMCAPCYKHHHYLLNQQRYLDRVAQWVKDHSNEHQEYQTRYHADHREEHVRRDKEYYRTHKKEHQAYSIEYRATHQAELAQNNKHYRETHKAEKAARDKAYKYKRMAEDLSYRLASNLRIRLNQGLRKNQKSGSAVRDCGKTMPELKIHLESLFYPNPTTGKLMTWDNWGKGPGTWQIHHIVELQSVDLTNREEFLQVCHYTNLRPLWHEDHWRCHRGGEDVIPS